jgi:hypothetical protein
LALNGGASLTLGPSGTLTMGAHALTLGGGSITSTGGSIVSAAITGFGTISAPITSGTITANNATPMVLGGTASGVTLAASGSGSFSLNGATLGSATLGGTGSPVGQFNVTGDSTLTGTISWLQYNTINIGGSNGAHTLNLNTAGTTTLSTVGGGAGPFTIGAGGTLKNIGGAATMGGGGTVTLNGGSITSTGGLFTISDPISGNGTISGNVDLNAGSEFVSGGTLTLNGVTIGSNSSGPGFSVGSGNTLDLQGNISAYSFNVNPGSGGTVLFDNTTISKAAGATGNVNINNNGLTTSGTFNVLNSSTLNNVNFSAGNGANLNINAPLTVMGGATVNATTTTIGSTGTLSLVNTTGATTGALTGNNLTMQNGALLVVGTPGHNGIILSGNFNFLQTNNLTGWTNNGVSGLGPDLSMIGGTSSTPVTLEVGGANKGYNPAAFIDNFALDSLTIGKGTTTPPAYVDLVDHNTNTTGAGTEILYLDALEGLPSTGPIGTLNLEGITAYVQGHGFLFNGLYVAPDGTEVNIIGANTTPEPATLALFGTGLLGLGLVRRRRRS